VARNWAIHATRRLIVFLINIVFPECKEKKNPITRAQIKWAKYVSLACQNQQRLGFSYLKKYNFFSINVFLYFFSIFFILD
jgi:hypothetical protein